VSDYGHELEFGISVTPSNQAAEAVVALSVLADQVGLDLVTYQDHPYQTKFLDTWTLLSFVAARTNHVRLAANVINVQLRPPAVLARAVASLDILSGGRAELGIGAGGFQDAIVAMGGRRLSRGQSVDALEEAIDVIRALWDVEEPGGARYQGSYYTLGGSKRGPEPVHKVGIWVGAYKPRMLDLTGRKADGWLPSLPYLEPGQLASGNEAIDEAAAKAGRDPRQIRRMLNVTGSFSDAGRGPLEGPPGKWVEDLTRFALEDGVGTFILFADDPEKIETFATEVAPRVREVVAARRSGSGGIEADGSPGSPSSPPAATALETAGDSEYERLGVTPTADAGVRFSGRAPWDEAARPHRRQSGPDVTYSDRGRLVGQHLVDVHDMLRTELTELREILAKVRDGAISAGAARSALNELALRQNDWTLGAFCARYCGAVAQHHGMEDAAIFPHLAQSDPSLPPVIQRLTDEHLVIHDAIQDVDSALVQHINHPEDFEGIQAALDFLTDSLLSHLSYEEVELVEPLARLGFYPDQV
jgi:alkanesulfonate monooxygenase SsuD/methylene tetrahydromethanopterin reductase-like flavin-dependent oxidoreductase (luciferase family)/hemerythrin-like domain-containing protein